MRWAWKRTAAIALAALAVVPATAAASSIKSAFGTGLEGWTMLGDPASGSPHWVSSGGNPGGFAEAVDAGAGQDMIWDAPAKFLGNRDAYYGGTLTFDRKVSTTSNYTPTHDVTLEGGGLSAHFKLSVLPGTTWTRQHVVLLPANTDDGTTAATLHTVLSNLTALKIEGEYVNGPETDSLDNVVLATPAVKAPKITSTALAKFKEGTAHTFKVTATGSPTPSLSIDGTLPAGLTFTDNGDGTGSLSGTPAAGSAGTYTVTVHATSTAGSATQALTIQVAQAPHFTSARSTPFANGTPSSFTVTTTGYPAPAITETGTLPPGVSFTDNGDGTAMLAGTPTGGAAMYRLSLTAKNAGGTATQTFTLTVTA